LGKTHLIEGLSENDINVFSYAAIPIKQWFRLYVLSIKVDTILIMRLIYATDIHGDFEKVKKLLYGTIADIYIIGGDLIDMPFYNLGTSIRYHELQSYFYGLRRKMDKEHMLLEDFVEDLLERPTTSEEIQDKGSKYQQYTIRARRVMQQKYKVLKNIILTKQNSDILCLPGNYDMNLQYTSLNDNDLHLRWYKLGGLSIAGYGGADVWTPGIPQKYIVKYGAGMGSDDILNEMYQFFHAVKPLIIVTHQPAYGINDKGSYGGPFGSPSLRTYCDNHEVPLCLTGHAHDAWGIKLKGNTIYLNPSNFGEVITPTGKVSEGGFFYQIELDKTAIKKIIFRKISNGNVYDIADYYVKKGGIAEDIIDTDRYNALKNRENFDKKVKEYSHIPEIELFNDIKNFFMMFQTREAEERIDLLEEAAHLLENKIHGHIAMDIMGSVNMGLSQSTSDIDMVLYVRCGKEKCTYEFDRCSYFKRAKRMIRKILGPKYDFDIMDCINLDLVEKSIRGKNFECEPTQRFVAYRSVCRPINYRVIAPVEDLLNKDILFRKELEGSIQSYMKIFTTTSPHMISFKKYESRLSSLGVKLPENIRRKIKKYLKENDTDST